MSPETDADPVPATLLAVIEGFYGAAWDATLWPAALRGYAGLVGARGAHLLLTERDSGNVLLGVVASRTGEATERPDRWSPCAPATPARQPFESDRLYLDGGRMPAVTRDAFLREHHRGEEQALVRLTGPPGTDIVLGFARNRRDGPLHPQQQEIAARAFSHVERAVALGHRLRQSVLQQAAARDALDAAPFGVALLAGNGRILSMNRRCRAITGRGDTLTIRDSRLCAARPAEDARLQRLIGNALAAAPGGGNGRGGAMRLARPAVETPYAVLVTPMPPRETLFTALRPAAAVFVRDPADMPQPSAETIAALYGLTGAEARIAAAIACGRTVKAYAASAGITENTARWMLKQVLSKTGTRSQADLVRVILAGPADLAVP